ncbi:NRDE family protein [Halobaculum sp. CBA1158]|uniref:NRDE family protein n=1 Tax=Halobaculum sp. CBA1158 TaxID=2904243 RepID=UPI001F3AEB14|nr:NRDE family protein [Halobaculum sp. CBA1158]UIO98430.1 NRDE family protein [Halobaculum sp. CBA1158]
MCTLTLAWRVFEGAPVCVAANRDESYGRPSEPPAVRDGDVVAPRDAEAGGTWMGVARDGPFVGITNRWVDGLAGERSRGLLVDDCLRAGSAEDAARLVEESCREHEYDGFNLVLADGEAAILLEWDGHLRVTGFEPGVHVVVNVGADGSFFEPAGRPEAGPEQADNAARLRGHLAPDPGESADAWLDRAGAALGDHEFGVCVHGDGFGTVSSSLIRVDADGGGIRYDHAEGPPCETAFEPVAVEW